MIAYQLNKKESKLAVIGLGYVGLPIALSFARTVSVIGFDKNAERVEMLNKCNDPSKQLNKKDFESCDIIFTSDIDVLKTASFFIAAVPTPVDEHKVPDLSMLLKACETIGKVIKRGDYVVFESTVYPGCTEEDCIPVIEEMSGLKAGVDFKFGYSPERINPGDTEHTLEKIVKVISACDDEALNEIEDVYKIVAKAGVYKASCVKVAEAAKVIENAQRDLNIALMNELSIIFDKANINTFEVLEAARTKWNFLPFSPGLVGGHCIGVDPYYLTYKAAALGFNSHVILAGRHINDRMGVYVAQKVLQYIIKQNGNVRNAKVLVMGVTFKENVPDIRNSKVADIVNTLSSFHLDVHVVDPLASSDDLKDEYGFGLSHKIDNDYNAVVLAVQHQQYRNFDASYFESITKENALIADIKGLYRNKINNRAYWSL
jgi:UDP-N-acetyl-D-galactosamine dehydrogenase